LGKDWYAAGKLGLAECAALQQRYPQAVEHYCKTVELLKENPHNRALSLEQVQRSLAAVAQELILRRDYEQALSFLEVEQQVSNELHTVLRYARTLASQAQQLLSQLQQAQSDAAQTEPTEQEQAWVSQQRDQIARLFGQAGTQFLLAAGKIIGDDSLYGDTLWQAATCFDKAGDTEQTIATWLRFVTEREGKPAWPRALFFLGQAYQSTGQHDKAIQYYETLHRTHPKSLAAFDAMVPLAQCYLAQQPPETTQARAILEGVLSNVALTPRSIHFREALWELGQLHYQEEEYARAISLLTEVIDRYPDDSRLGKFMFLVADSYRHSGLALDDALAQLGDDPAGRVSRQRLHEQRNRYLDQARDYFARAIDFYSAVPEERRARLDQLYLRQCWLYQADCLYDMARYEEAIHLYELAALRYQLTPTALAAFNQVINCHLKLGQADEARATAQRARWQLREMPAEVFATSPTSLSHSQWESWFAWLGQSNLWRK
jgi:TolA-binding protein